MQVRLEFHVKLELQLRSPDETASLFGDFIHYIGTNTAECEKRIRHGITRVTE
jgi:hypothetical protein